MTLKDYFDQVITGLESPALPFTYESKYEANLDLDNAVFPHVVCLPFYTGRLRTGQNGAVKKYSVVTLQFINTTAILEDDTDTNNVIIQAMELLAIKFVTKCNRDQIIEPLDDVQINEVRESMYNVNAVGVEITFETAMRKGTMIAC